MKISTITNFCEIVIASFKEYLDKEKISPQIRAHRRHFCTELSIAEGGSQASFSEELIDLPFWDSVEYQFIESKIKTLSKYTELKNIILHFRNQINKSASISNEEAQVDYWLERFVKRILDESINGLTHDQILDFAEQFKLEIGDHVPKSNYVDYISGIYIEQAEPIVLKKGVIIRKTRKEDLVSVHGIPGGDLPQNVYTPHAIIECTEETSDINFQNYQSRIMNAFRLFRLGSIYSRGTSRAMDTVIGHNWRNWSYRLGPNFSFKNYTLKSNEIDEFTQFIVTIEKKLRVGRDEKQFRSLFIALDRYNSALLEEIDNERRIMTAVMGLEALLTTDSGENSFKLKMRVAKIFENLGMDSEKIAPLILESYKFRNYIVHGSDKIEQKDRMKIDEMLPEILNLLRMSLIIFIMRLDESKRNFIDLIDGSLIHDAKNQKLKQIVTEIAELYPQVFTDMK